MKNKWQIARLMIFLTVLFLFASCGNPAQTDAPTPYVTAPQNTAPPVTTPAPLPTDTTTPTPTPPEPLRAEPFAVPASGFYPAMHGPAIRVVEGRDVSFAILYDHSLWAWGVNDYGQLGYGPGAWWSTYPIRVMENVAYVAVSNGIGPSRRVYAVTNDGGLYAWGADLLAETLDVRTGAGIRFTPERIMDDIALVAIGYFHTLTVTSAGDLYMLGNKWLWQSGSNITHGDFATPVHIMSDVVDIATGQGQSLAVTASGAVYVWGVVGYTTFTCPLAHRYGIIDVPLRVPGINNAVAVTTSDTYGGETLVRTADGRVWMWGGETHHGFPNTAPPTLMPIGGFAVDISTSHWRSYALTDDGNVWEWATIEGHRGFWLAATDGDFMPDFIARYGIPETDEDHDAFWAFRMESVEAQANAAMTPFITASNVSSIEQAVGWLFVAENGDIWRRTREWVAIDNPVHEWHTHELQTHYENITHSDPDHPTPQSNEWFRPWERTAWEPGPFHQRPPITNLEVARPIPHPVIAVAVGYDTSFAITDDHRLWAWGSSVILPSGNAFASRRNPDPRPIMYNVAAIKAGGRFILVLTLDGTLVRLHHTAQPILTDVIAIATGEHHAMALTADGSLYTWGDNHYGQLGGGTFDARETPVPIMHNVTAIAAGGNQSLAIRECGGLYIWGAHGIHALRDDWGYTLAQHPRATPYRFMENIQSAAAGTWHALAITTASDLYAWGDNWYGATGVETFHFHDTPIRIKQNIRQVVASGLRWSNSGHTLAITHDNELWAWGSGFLPGDGSPRAFRLPPTRIMENIATAATNRHIMVATAEGHLYAWAEYNYWGVLAGLGPISPTAQIPFTSHVPVRITGGF